MRARKTIDVETVIGDINHQLKFSIADKEFREGLISIAEQILMKTGNYKGFSYLTKDEIPLGELPGIRPQELEPKEKFDNTDHTRVRFSLRT